MHYLVLYEVTTNHIGKSQKKRSWENMYKENDSIVIKKIKRNERTNKKAVFIFRQNPNYGYSFDSIYFR